MDYGFYATVEGPFDLALQRVTEALKNEGFGVLSDIDVQKAMKDKLGVEMPAHRILGACNPKLAHQALEAEPDASLLLPCNVTLREEGGRIKVGFLNPDTMVNLTGNLAMKPVAEDASARLHRVRDVLEGSRID
jgi:uncharacterized protein (DUF302 family)